MAVRRPLVLMLAAFALALLAACSSSGNGNGSATPDGGDDGIVDPRATLRHVAQTAEAAGTKAAQGNTPRPIETPLPLSELSGDFEVRFRLQERLGDEQLEGALEMPDNLDVLIGEGTVTISGREPFVSVTGSLSDEGAISAAGAGSIGMFGEVSATFEGTLEDARLAGMYTLTGAGIPGGSVTFEIAGGPD